MLPLSSASSSLSSSTLSIVVAYRRHDLTMETLPVALTVTTTINVMVTAITMGINFKHRSALSCRHYYKLHINHLHHAIVNIVGINAIMSL